MDIVDNVIPFIKGEESKVESETQKILGTASEPANFKVSSSCHRVPIVDGHLMAVFVETKKKAEPIAVAEAMEEFLGEPQKLKLPSAPEKPVIVTWDSDRPQTRLDRMEGNGMSTVVGRIRKDPILKGVKFIALGHNTIRGAAGCGVLNAEYLKVKNFI
jgi:aspartate-semialdehyde dehydrogenase